MVSSVSFLPRNRKEGTQGEKLMPELKKNPQRLPVIALCLSFPYNLVQTSTKTHCMSIAMTDSLTPRLSLFFPRIDVNIHIHPTYNNKTAFSCILLT